jgi:hypothetical protein
MIDTSITNMTKNTANTGTVEIASESEASLLCLCQKCGKLVPEISEVPCRKRNCPKCGSKLLRI